MPLINFLLLFVDYSLIRHPQAEHCLCGILNYNTYESTALMAALTRLSAYLIDKLLGYTNRWNTPIEVSEFMIKITFSLIQVHMYYGMIY
jgi:hypothetical protein